MREDATTSGVEMLVPIFAEVLGACGLTKADIGFWCSGSSDYLAGRAFSFVSAVDAIGAVPPAMESHVEMDAAWALYEAWTKVLTGEAEIALAYGFGKSSGAELRRVLALQLDPYLLAPLWPDSVSVAALQARLGLEAGRWTEKDMAEVAARSRAAAAVEPGRPGVGFGGGRGSAGPALRGRAAAGARLRPGRGRGRGGDHRDGGPGPGAVRAARLDQRVRAPGGFGLAGRAGPAGCAVGAGAARRRGLVLSTSPDEVAELHAPFSHQELLLREALGLGEGVVVNPSGGALCGNPMFAAGLARIGLAARAVMSGRAGRALGHATSGPALQQNLVCVLSGEAS